MVHQPNHFKNQDDIKSLRAFALGELKWQRNSSDIIEQLCLRTGWDWEEAEKFLNTITEDNQNQIEIHKSLQYMLISIILIAIGVLQIAVYCLCAIYNPRTGGISLPHNLEQGIPFLITQFIWLLLTPLGYLFSSLALSGIGMVIGGVVGLVRNSIRVVLWR